ncbi:hypothetical protein OEZ86_010372, partial [Tetradesmus obliquus]
DRARAEVLKQITAGSDHKCVRKPNGHATCWGCATGACNIPWPSRATSPAPDPLFDHPP